MPPTHYCDSIGWTVASVILLITTLSALMVGIVLTVQHFRRQEKKPGVKLVFYAGFTFAVVTCILFVIHGVQSFACLSRIYGLFRLVRQIAVPGLLIQFYLLLFCFFITVKTAFNGTAWQLSKCTVGSFYIPFCIGFSAIVVGRIIPPLAKPGGLLSVFIMIICMIFIVVLFVKKLAKLYRGDDEDIANLMTKITMLVFISICATILDVSTSLIRTKFAPNSPIMFFVYSFFYLVDIMTNFTCVILSYTTFNDYYGTLCGAIHTKWRYCLMRCVGGKNARELSKAVTNTNSADSGDSADSTVEITVTTDFAEKTAIDK